MEIKSTKDIALNGVSLLVYGLPGVGKTTLIKTLKGKVLILSAEAGLLSLQGTDLGYIEIHSLSELYEAFNFVLDHKSEYDCVVLDSISEIAEICLQQEKLQNKDGRMAYGNMTDQVNYLIRAFRDLPINVYMTAKLEKAKDEISGRIMFQPSMPGQKASQAIPYYFDEVFILRSEVNENNENIRFLQTFTDASYIAKDRSGRLDAYEEADLGKVIEKIGGRK